MIFIMVMIYLFNFIKRPCSFSLDFTKKASKSCFSSFNICWCRGCLCKVNDIYMHHFICYSIERIGMLKHASFFFFHFIHIIITTHICGVYVLFLDIIYLLIFRLKLRATDLSVSTLWILLKYSYYYDYFYRVVIVEFSVQY